MNITHAKKIIVISLIAFVMAFAMSIFVCGCSCSNEQPVEEEGKADVNQEDTLSQKIDTVPAPSGNDSQAQKDNNFKKVQ